MEIEGLSVVVEIMGSVTRSRTVSAASLKPFYTRPSDVRHPMGDGFAHMTWGADVGLEGYPTPAALMYTLQDRKRVVSATGVASWEYRGRYLVGEASGLGLGGGVTGQLHSAVVGYVSLVVELVRSQQRAESPRSPRRGGERTPRAG